MQLEGTGSVEQLEKGKERRLCKKWRIWQKADGKNRSRRINGTYTEAKKALVKFRKELEAEVTCGESFADYAQGWLYIRQNNPDFSPNTIKRDIDQVRALQAMFGAYRLTDIKPSTVQAKMNERGTRGGTTMNNLFVRLSSILRAAVNDELIASNPCDKVKPPKKDTKEKHALDKDGVNAFLDRLDAFELDGRVMACYFMVLQGLRRSEALALYDADVSGGITNIHQALKEANLTIGTTKSKAGTRVIPQPKRLQAKIQEWSNLRHEYGYSETFCCNTLGGILAPQNLYRWYCKNFGDLGVTLHELRHTNLTMMARELSVFGLKYWAGWSSLEPARIYIHNDKEELFNAVSRFDLMI